MTTVAYKHKDREIAVDSRVTCGVRIEADNAVKYLKEGGDTFIFAGVVCDYELLVDFFYDRGTADGPLPDCVCFVISGGKAYKAMVQDDGRVIIETLTHDSAIGSGCDFALAAMDFGRTAKEAVKYAMTRDMYTGGRIKVFRVK